MYDAELVTEILRQILWSAVTITRRFEAVTSPEEFTSSESGRERFDGICMQLIAIGESVKHVDGITEGGLLPQYPQVEWKRVMGMRDVLSHHYFDIDAEAVYAVCDLHIEVLAQTVRGMIADLDMRSR
ncbi:MAG: DUF86 domain-containing protein [Anaerolineae bacterium]|jgi:uncharacterized protein with HEPN domain